MTRGESVIVHANDVSDAELHDDGSTATDDGLIPSDERPRSIPWLSRQRQQRVPWQRRCRKLDKRKR